MVRPSFIELPVRDIATCKEFYEQAFGMKFAAFGPTYACTMTGDIDIGLQADTTEATSGPLAVFQVEDLNAALIAVANSGGAITRPIFSFPGGRRFHVRDPAGNEIGVWKPD